MNFRWSDLIPHELENITFENKSIDVVISGCFEYFDTTACVRNSVLTFLGLITLLFCISVIIRLHVLQQSKIHQYLIFYFASFETLFLIVKWTKISLYQTEFVASFLKMMQFVLLCHFYWSVVSRILHQQKLINWIIVPLLGIFFFAFSSIAILGILSKFPPWLECFSPHWLLLSFVEFLGIQLYVVAGIYITRNINTVAALDSFKREQKRDLWSVIVTYELSSFVSLAYYMTILSLGNLENGCSGIFKHTQNIYTPVYATVMVIKYLLPIWVMLAVFYPDGSYFSEEEQPPWWSRDGSTTSMFDPEARYQGSYKQLVEPVSDEPGLRRSASSPALSSPRDLSSISEEDPILPPARTVYVNYGALEGQSEALPPIRPRSNHVSSGQSAKPTRSRHDSSRQSGKGLLRRSPTVVRVSINRCPEESTSRDNTFEDYYSQLMNDALNDAYE